MKILIFLTSIALALLLTGCKIVIEQPEATTTIPPQTETTTEVNTTVPPTEATTVPTTVAPTTEAAQPPTPAPTDPPTQKKTDPPTTVRKTAPPKTAPAKTIPPENNTNKTISASAAQKAALAHAGVKESDARGLRAEPDYDDGRFEYDVEFYANGFEYDYEIDGNSGRIISYDKDRD